MFWEFLSDHAALLQQKILEHVALTVCSLLMASCIAIPLGIGVSRSVLLRKIILPAGSISQTIPCLAILGFLIPILGLGNTPTLVALTFYALYPILKSTFTGIMGIPEEYLEAANGLGFSKFQKLWFVELPLALPSIVSGLRLATAMTIGIASIASLIGAGGLGDFIMQGLSLNDSSLILLGAIPTALLALVFDYAISRFEIGLQTKKARSSRFYKVQKSSLWLLSLGVFLGTASFYYKDVINKKNDGIVIASKNFTESWILAEMMAQLIEKKGHVKVTRKFNLGTTHMIHQAMLKKEVDLYPEYTGTAYLTILKGLKGGAGTHQERLFKKVQLAYKNRFNFTWLEPFGFSNSQALTVKADYANHHKLKSLSDLTHISSTLNIAAPPEFLKRPDALPGLCRAYALQFKNVLQVDSSLMYLAIKNNKVEVIAAFSTDGRLQKNGLVTLEDDRKFYPSYEAAPVVRHAVLKVHPEIYQVLSPLFGFINQEKIMDLNYQVDVEGKRPAEVVRQFLLKFNLI